MQQVTRHRRVLLALLVAVVLLAGAAPASAADTYAPGVAYPCNWGGGGGRDRDHNLYLQCGGTIHVVRPDGSRITRGLSGVSGNGIAPSPDGSILYVINGSDLYRAVLQNGTYYRDAGWVPATVGGRRPCGRGVATDAYGFVYIANGGWCTGNNQVVKYRPDGTIVTAFGDYGDARGMGVTDRPGMFNTDMDLDVSSDGRRIYVADHLNVRVQYFDWQWNGTYRFTGAWRIPSANYGVKLDPWGYVYAASTTGADIHKYTAEGAFITTVANEAAGRIHGISVDARGHVYSGEMGKVYPRSAGNALPGPLPAPNPMPRTDTRDPLVQAVDAPAETTAGSVRVRITATDPDGNTITHMRLADESGEFGGWQHFATELDVTLSAGLGTKAVYVQVRDAAGRISEARAAVVRRIPIPDVADPIVTITAPTTSYANLVQLGIHASDDIGVTHLRVAGEDGEFSAWQPWSSGSSTLQRALTPGLGVRIVAVQVRDAAFRVSGTAQVSILVTTPPVVVAPPADAGAAGGGAVPVPVTRDRIAPRLVALWVPRRSCSRRIVLRIAARDNRGVRLVRVANENGRYGRWRRATPRVVHFLSRGVGRKAVYVQVRDAAGNVSSAKMRRTVVVKCGRRR